MEIEILAVTPDAEKIIERAGRTCYKSYDRITEDSSGKFIRKLIKAGHLSVLEHAYITIKLKNVSRVLTHQLVRHRLCSYSQASQRYVNEENFSFVIPPKIEKNKEAKDVFIKIMEEIRETYKSLLDTNIPKEDARYVLPNATHTEIVFSCNFRELRHILKLRGSPHAQWEIRKMCIKILEEVKKIAPNCFFDLEIDKEKEIIVNRK